MTLVNNLSSILSSCLHCFSLLWCYILFLTHPFLFCLCLLGRFLYIMSSFFDCFLASAWWAVLHLLHYSYFDASTPSVLRFFWSKERLAWKIAYVLFSGEMKSECIRIYYLESQCGDQPLQSCGFWEEHFTWKLKKIEYVSFSEVMKSECIRIYIVWKVLNVA